MGMNEPYSRMEGDLKQETMEQRTQMMFAEIINRFNLVDQKFEHVDQKFDQVYKQFDYVDEKFEAIKSDIRDMKGLVTATGIGLLIALAGVVLPISIALWSSVVRFPIKF